MASEASEEANNLQKNESKMILDSDDDVDSYYNMIMPKIAAAVKASNSLPAGDQYDFYTTYKEFLDVMHVEGTRALQIVSRLLRHNGIRSSTFTSGASSSFDASEKFEALIDGNDQLTERIGTKLDEQAGLRKAPEVELLVATASPDVKSNQSKGSTTPFSGASWNTKREDAKKTTNSSYRLLAARFVKRPQTQFKEKVDNSDKPFRPRLTDKPNALIPLNESMICTPSESKEEITTPNPYKYEIERFDYTEWQMELTVKFQMPKPLSVSGPLTYIDSVEGLDKLVDELVNVNEIAVDLEAHSYRSFQGLTCLMQISTRSHDYIIDTLALRAEIQKLNIVFTNPKILKVFHGANSDVEWLQRDFSVYIVNMFDTYQASKALSFSRHSLAFLMKHYCNVVADKQYQLADWRIRPLPQELIDYAREDTHYLLYIYDRMKNALLEKGNKQKNLLKSVLDESRNVCLQTYVKPELCEESFMALYTRSRKSFNNRQLHALRKLFAWRFRLAQQEDESTGYVLPNHIMLQICEVLPRESSGVLACCTPVPPLVRQHLHTIHSLIVEARTQPLTSTQTLKMDAQLKAKQRRSIVDRPHDSRADEVSSTPSSLPTSGNFPRKKNSVWSFLSPSTVKSEIADVVKKIKESFISPLANYSPVKFIDLTLQSSTNNQSFKRLAESDNKVIGNSSAQEEWSATPAKRAREDNESHHEVSQDSNGVKGNPDKQETGLEDGEIASTKKKRATRKNNSQKLPLRLRPASNPEKKLVEPNTDFQPYNYAEADYSEFKPEQMQSKPKKSNKFDKNQRSKNWRPSSEKSCTFKS